MKEGGFGIVSRCELRNGGGTRAVKIVKKAKLKPRELELLLGAQGELEKHFRLKHSHIVPLYEAFHDRDTVSLVMQYCSGGDLFDAVTACKLSHGAGLSETAAAVAMSHVLLALDYLHSLSIVHRDVKLENVLLLHGNTPIEHNIHKLCDFGFAAYDEGSCLKDIMGSFFSTAPEVLLGHSYGSRSDLWSAGVALYMMLVASVPFTGSPKEMLWKASNEQYSMMSEPWQHISKPAKTCISSMLVANPAERPNAAEVLSQHAWLSLTLLHRIQSTASGKEPEHVDSHESAGRLSLL
jgi:calcium-dependent protein kinase